jgi:hypothetical protein
LKDELPGSGVAVTHCAPSRHWRREADGLLVINLESMWDDFAASVSCLVSRLEATPSEREIALNRYRERTMIVSPFAPHRASSPLTHRRQAAPGRSRRGSAFGLLLLGEG